LNKVDGFLADLETPNTRATYGKALRWFQQLVAHRSLDVYVKTVKDPLPDVALFVKRLQIKQAAPKSVTMATSALRSYLRFCGKRFNDDDWKDATRRTKGHNKPITFDTVPTKEEWVRLLRHMRLQPRAFWALVSSSGLRPAEAWSLRLQDIDLEKDPAVIRVQARTAKTGTIRRSFCTPEAKALVQQWLARRAEAGDPCGPADRVFTFQYAKDPSDSFRDAVKALGLAKKESPTQIHSLHGYTSRKWFDTTAKNVDYGPGISGIAFVECLMGHYSAALDNSYYRLPEETQAELYRRAIPALTIGVVPAASPPVVP
jgi:integrase